MEIKDLKQGDKIYDFTLTQVKWYTYFCVHPTGGGKYHILIDNCEEPIRIYHSKLQDILDKKLTSYKDAQRRIAEKLEELSKYMRERSETPLNQNPMIKANPDFNLLGSEPGKKLRFKPLIKPTKRDWIEDFDHENGYYQNNCRDCKLNFFGFKQRMWCKACIKPKKVKQKKPTGIIKDLMELQRYELGEDDDDYAGCSACIITDKNGQLVEWSDIETIIKKYNP